jgi:hypothetical protein
MKRNYQYLQGGGNLPQKKLPKLDDSEIEKLYEFYASKDKFHSKFKGTKRDYCYKASDLINNFLNTQHIGKSRKLSGRGYEEDLVRARKIIKPLIKISGKEVQTKKVTKKENVYTRGEEFKKSGSTTLWGTSTNDLTMKDIEENAAKYLYVLDLYVDDKVAQTNFLLTASFNEISLFTPQGIADRKEFSTRGGYSNIGVGTGDWSDIDEAAYRTEYDYCKYVLLPLGHFKNADGTDWSDTKIRFYCLKKAFSEKAKYETVDFPFDKVLYEGKGNKTFENESRSVQVDTKKITEIIFNSFKDPKQIREVIIREKKLPKPTKSTPLDKLEEEWEKNEKEIQLALKTKALSEGNLEPIFLIKEPPKKISTAKKTAEEKKVISLQNKEIVSKNKEDWLALVKETKEKTLSERPLLTKPKKCHISFIKYSNNSKINSVERNADGELVKGAIPIEAIIDWDLTEMLETPTGKKILAKLKPEIEKYNQTFEPKKATQILKNQDIDDLMFGLFYKYFGVDIASHVGGYKGGTKGLTTLSLDISKENIAKKFKLLAYAPEIIPTGISPTVENYYKRASDEEISERFLIRGSSGLKQNSEIIESMSKSNSEELPVYTFGTDTDTTDVFSLKASVSANASVKDKLITITGQTDIRAPALNEWVKKSEEGKHFLRKKRSAEDVKKFILETAAGTYEASDDEEDPTDDETFDVEDDPDDESESDEEEVKNTIVESESDEEVKNTIVDEDDVRDDNTTQNDTNNSTTSVAIAPVETEFDKVKREILEKNKDILGFKIDGRIKNVEKLKKKYL